MESRNFEFDPSQKKLVRDLAQKMRFVSYVFIALGAVVILRGISSLNQGGISSIIGGVVQIIVGFWTFEAAAAFRRIVDTQGNDVENLMEALGELRKLYTFQYWLILIVVIFIVVAIIIALVSGAFG